MYLARIPSIFFNTTMGSKAILKYVLPYIFFLFCFSLNLGAQNHPLKITVSGDSIFFKNKIVYKNSYANKREKDAILNKVLLDMYANSYVSAHFENLTTDTNHTLIKLITGKTFQWTKLHPGNVDEAWLSVAGYRSKLFSSSPFNQKQLKDLIDKILGLAENNGYPFASLQLKNVVINETGVEAELFLNKDRRIVWDSLEVVGDKDTAINRDFLRIYLGLLPGKPYNEKTARNIRTRLKEVLYIKVNADPQIIFKEDKAKPIIFIDEQKANRLDGVLGLAPNSSQNNSLLLTGEANLALLNVMGDGIKLTLGYKSFLRSSQQINVSAEYPYFLGLPIGITEEFNLAKFDSTYYVLDNKLGMNYYLNGKDYFRLIYNNYSTHLLNASMYAKTNALPPYLDVATDWYGIGLHLEDFDYKYNPRSGYSIYIEGSVGTKVISKNVSILSSLYDSLQLRKVVYKYVADISYFIPLALRSTLNLGIQSALLADNEMTPNQIFKIGGLHNLRGFDEQSIYASSYYIPRVEYRYLVDRNSNFQLFYNMAYYREDIRNYSKHDTPMGMGLGYNYLTKAGLFSISFAVGKQMDNPFDFNAAKVHIGYLNRF